MMRILFSTPYIPYQKARLFEDNIDFFYYRNTLKQGIFQLRQNQSWHPLHFLAQNLPVSSLVLENPTLNRFKKELLQHHYDVVALTFSVITTSRILEMATWVKKHSPGTEVIIGGYGTAVFSEPCEISDRLRSAVDHICKGDGLDFLSAYLEEKYGITSNKPLVQNLLPIRVSLFRTRLAMHLNLNFIAALGCNFHCSFCSTSSQFKQKKILFSGENLYRSVKQGAERYPRATSGVIFDEDFLENREAVLEFMHCMEKDSELITRPFYLTVFSSAHNVARYTLSELIRCGIGMLYIGVESFDHVLLETEKLKKRGGSLVDIEQLFGKLHKAGIHTLGSIIIGWDDHTNESIPVELNRFIQMNPTLYQVMPLQAVPGTPLWQRMKKEGRINPDFTFDKARLEKSSFRFKNITQEESMNYILDTYQKLVDEGGPWPFRMLENMYKGIQSLEKEEGSEFRNRVKGYKKILPPLFVLSCICGLLFYGKGFRKRWRRVMGKMFLERPLWCMLGWIMAIFALPVLSGYVFLGSLRHLILPAGDQPETIRMEYQNPL